MTTISKKFAIIRISNWDFHNQDVKVSMTLQEGKGNCSIDVHDLVMAGEHFNKLNRLYNVHEAIELVINFKDEVKP